MYISKTTVKDITFYKINHDANGNPRYVFQFLHLADTYTEAVKKAKNIGAKKYNAKWFGGGLVIQSYNLCDTADSIKKLQNN